MGQSQSHPPSNHAASSTVEDILSSDASWVEVPAPRRVSFSTEEGAPGAEYRASAALEAARRNELYQRSQEAWRENRRAEAKRFSSRAKVHAEKMVHYHSLAEAEIFAFHNKNYPAQTAAAAAAATTTTTSPTTKASTPSKVFSPFSIISSLFGSSPPPATPTLSTDDATKKGLGKLDLHRLFVREAIARVETHLELCREHKVKRTVIITGKGLHSVDGIAKIKPKVEEMLMKRGVKIVAEEKRRKEGVLIVEFEDGTVEQNEVVVEETKKELGIFWKILGW